ncbi:MAG: ATP-binding cassette domain-containing protein [Lachnospiraceae bacterium]|nr:ATP-binding cassette domain-containing protein [Lachnospiraceae bacterium]
MKIIAKRLESDSGKNTDTIIDSKPTNNEISGLDKPNEDRLYENQDIKQLLPIKNLNKAFGNLTVFKGFNSEILSGAVNAILGPSGGGKTTLLRILMGLEKADYDELPIEGAKYACVFQEDRLCGHLSAFKNIEMVRGSNIENSEILVALSDVGLKDHEFKPVRELSGGMKRRVAIIRALLSDYDILVLDEPFKGLDETLRKEVMAYVREKTSGKTVLFVTHEPEEVEAMGAKHSIFVNQLISR